VTPVIRGAAAALLVLVALPAYAAGDHEMLAAEQEMKIARGHLQAAGTDYGGHRRAAMDHLDDALREIREAIQFSRGGGKPSGEHGAKHPAPHPGTEPDDD
jgi:hypothetical protein